MEKKLIVIALGGNALQIQGEAPTVQNQIKNIKIAIKNIVKLIQEGHKIVIIHGNGPQVGRLVVQSEIADSPETPAFDFDICGAMSQALIGYHIQQCLQNELKKNKIIKEVATVITQIEVDKNDEAFNNLTKPIGPFYDALEKEKLESDKNYIIKKDGNRGYRRVIASPKPKKILEIEVIKNLVQKDNIVICCGGGGIPVIQSEEGYSGVAAVIDKDNATNLLAQQLNADTLAILTEVKEVAINFGKENQKNLNNISTNELLKHKENNEFAPGSMLPKVEAVIDFVNKTGNKAIITTLDNLDKAVKNKNSGTIIFKKD